MRLNFVHDCTKRKFFNDGKKPDYDICSLYNIKSRGSFLQELQQLTPNIAMNTTTVMHLASKHNAPTSEFTTDI